MTSNHNQIFTYSSESGAKFECALDTSTFTSCSEVGLAVSDLATGQHTFKVRATDVRGSVDPTPAEYSWTIQDYSNTPDTSWPQVGDGSEIRAVIPDGSGGWYVGGSFSQLCDSSGCHTRNNIAHIKSDKTVDSWNPSIGPGSAGGVPVRALALKQSTNTLYVGGAFTSVNGDTGKTRLAALDTQTNGHFTWDPEGVAWVYGLALAPDTDTIYIGGTFGIAGASHATRNRLAEIKLDSTADVTPWDPNVTGVPGGPGPQVWTIALSDTKLYAGGISIGGAGGQTNTGNLIEIDRATGAASATWRPMPNNAVHALAFRSPSASTLFVGGTFTSIGSTAQSRNKAAEINLDTTGTATGWDPQAAGGAAATYAFGFVHGTVLMGGQWTTIQGQARTRLAQTTGSLGAPLTWTPSLDSAPFVIANQGSVLAVGGIFQNAASTPRKFLAFYGPPD